MRNTASDPMVQWLPAAMVLVAILALLVTREGLVPSHRLQDVPQPPAATKLPEVKDGHQADPMPVPADAAASPDVLEQRHLRAVFLLRHGHRAAAMREFLKAAVCGDVKSQSVLARAFASGRGLIKDPARAYLWASLAALEGTARDIGNPAFPEDASGTLSPEALTELQAAILTWVIRAPDESLSCMTEAEPADEFFLGAPFDIPPL